MSEKRSRTTISICSELLLELDNIDERLADVPRRRNYFSRRMLIAVVLLLLIVAAGLFGYSRLNRVPTLAILPIIYESSDPDRNTWERGSLTVSSRNSLVYMGYELRLQTSCRQ